MEFRRSAKGAGLELDPPSGAKFGESCGSGLRNGSAGVLGLHPLGQLWLRRRVPQRDLPGSQGKPWKLVSDFQ